jgi:hypothetical protein
MRELHADFLSLTVNKINETLKWCNLRVFPEPRILRGDPPISHDGSSFHNSEASSAESQSTQMHDVEVGQVTIVCGEHAHGCHPDAVLKCHRPNCERLEDVWDMFRVVRGNGSYRRVLQGCEVRCVWCGLVFEDS